MRTTRLLARASLSGAGVLLNEPAAHLDPRDLADALLAEVLATGPAVVVVTHQISPLRMAGQMLAVDRVAVVGLWTLLGPVRPRRD